MENTPIIQVAYDAVMQTGESPLWHADEQVLYWVDIPARTVHRLDPASGAHHAWLLESEPASLAIADSGGLIVATRNGVLHLDTASTGASATDIGATEARTTVIAPAPYDTAITRFNDGKVDGAGRYWIGTIYEPRDQPAAAMYVLEQGNLRCAWTGGMTNSNGLAFSPDQKTMYHADTSAHLLRRFDYDVATGTVGAEHVFRQFSADKANNYGGRPDGGAVDSEGNYWSALFEGARIVKLSPQGEVLAEIALPVRCPTMVAFGGPNLRTLYITSAGARPAEELAQYPFSGKLLALQVDVAGRPEPAYRQ